MSVAAKTEEQVHIAIKVFAFENAKSIEAGTPNPVELTFGGTQGNGALACNGTGSSQFETALAEGHDALPDQDVRFISSAYAGAIAHGRAENPPDRTGDPSKAGKLVERFATHRDMILRFVVDLAVPFTNNSAERALRPVKLQQKTSGTWRILQGLANFAAVRSYLDTAHKHGKDAIDVLRQLFTTGPWLPAVADSG